MLDPSWNRPNCSRARTRATFIKRQLPRPTALARGLLPASTPLRDLVMGPNGFDKPNGPETVWLAAHGSVRRLPSMPRQWIRCPTVSRPQSEVIEVVATVIRLRICNGTGGRAWASAALLSMGMLRAR